MKHFKLMKGIFACLLSLALVVTCFTVGAKADETTTEATPTKSTAVAAEYNATTDTVTASSNAYVYVVKAASGNKIKAGTAATAQMTENKVKISDLGIKGTKKDVFLYVCDKEIEVEETVAANLTIKGNTNKVVGVVDYTQADDPGSEKVLSAYYVDKSTKKQVAIASTSLYWSADQEKWYLANSLTQSDRKNSKNETVADGFLGNDLAGMLEAGGTIYIKQVGTTGTTGTAQFGSAVTKVKIAKQAKAPKAKIDVSKDTIAIKNGFDFALAVKNEETKEYEILDGWYTILPVLKTATVASEGESIVGGVIGADDNEKLTAYKPLGKKDTNAGKVVKTEDDENYYYSYTKYKFKALSNDKLFEIILANFNGTVEQFKQLDYKIAVRKSATEKKPASAYTLVDLKLQTEAPIVYTESNVKGQFLVASADEFTKKGITLGEIVAFAGYEGTNNKTIATEGFDSTFALKAAADSIKERDEGSTFEYAVVSTADYFATGDAAIDWTTVKWKKFDPAKLKITEKLSGKYSTVKGTKKTADLKGTASSEIKQTGDDAVTEPDAYGRTVIKDDAIKAGTKSLLLIRRQGDKASGKRASEPVALYVAKENKKYNLYSTVSNGVMADKYTVVFFKYDSTKGGFYRDETIEAITGWSQKANTGVKLDALTDAEYWPIAGELSASGAGTLGNAKYVAATTKVEAGNDTDGVQVGEYSIAIGANADENGEDQTINIAIREYANIKVKGTAAVKGATDTAVANSDKELAQVVKGKVYVWNGTSKKFEAPTGDDNVVTAYVGSDIVLTLNAPAFAYPTGYEADGTNKYKAVEGQRYAYDTSELTVKPASAEELEEVITYYVKLKKVQVNYNANKEGVTLTKTSDTVDYGTTVTLPTPTSEGLKFEGWFTDEGCTKAFDAKTPITSVTDLYAKWTEVNGG